MSRYVPFSFCSLEIGNFPFLSAGHYMFIEASRPQTAGDKADLLTPMLTSAKAKCLTFYYHMKGSTIGSLKIFQKVRQRFTLCDNRSYVIFLEIDQRVLTEALS